MREMGFILSTAVAVGSGAYFLDQAEGYKLAECEDEIDQIGNVIERFESEECEGVVEGVAIGIEAKIYKVAFCQEREGRICDEDRSETRRELKECQEAFVALDDRITVLEEKP